eukprot:COSAG01_NODE_2537_length_7450_cov_5.509411_1_plen_358_part_00
MGASASPLTTHLHISCRRAQRNGCFLERWSRPAGGVEHRLVVVGGGQHCGLAGLCCSCCCSGGGGGMPRTHSHQSHRCAVGFLPRAMCLVLPCCPGIPSQQQGRGSNQQAARGSSAVYRHHLAGPWPSRWRCGPPSTRTRPVVRPPARPGLHHVRRSASAAPSSPGQRHPAARARNNPTAGQRRAHSYFQRHHITATCRPPTRLSPLICREAVVGERCALLCCYSWQVRTVVRHCRLDAADPLQVSWLRAFNDGSTTFNSTWTMADAATPIFENVGCPRSVHRATARLSDLQSVPLCLCVITLIELQFDYFIVSLTLSATLPCWRARCCSDCWDSLQAEASGGGGRWWGRENWRGGL